MSETVRHGALMDSRAVQDELGVSYEVAVKLMRQLPEQRIPGVKKSYVRRDALERLLEENLHRKVG